jgi:5-methylthioadenosine/S-adenosylhomocysteine deaminase
MRTLIQGGHVVGFDNGRHHLDRNHQVVFEGNSIIYVGPNFDGDVDERIDATDMLVSPGFIDPHVHSGHRATHRLISDVGRPDFFGQPFLEITVPKEGKRVDGDARYLKPGDTDASFKLELWATYTVAELLRNGITTFIEHSAQQRVQEALLTQCVKLGVRGYLGCGYDSGRFVCDSEGRLKRIRDEEGGIRAFHQAVSFLERVDGTHDGMIKGILVPCDVDTCTVDLLKASVAKADELKMPIATHAAYSVIEFYDIVREHRMTPIELLDSIGMLRPTTSLGHANLIAEHPRLSYSGGRDLKLMGAAKVSISHCPINLIRRARSLDSWQKYTEAGVNITIGSDTYPRDMIMNMRHASYHGKVMSNNLSAATAAEVFNAATINGAISLGRDDLGRLAAGARADIILIDMSGRGTLRYGPIRDPIKSLVECGIGDDVDTVIVNGMVRMRNRTIPGIDIASIGAAAQRVGEEIWASVPNWDPLGRTAEQMCPWAFNQSCGSDRD